MLLFQAGLMVPKIWKAAGNKNAVEGRIRENIYWLISGTDKKNIEVTAGKVNSYLETLGEREAIIAADILRKIIPKQLARKLNANAEAVREIVFRAIGVVAQAWAANKAKEIAELRRKNPSGFRRQYGGYDYDNNNCRHIVLRIYFDLWKNSLTEEVRKKLKKEIFGRPKNWDWKGDNHLLPKISVEQFSKKNFWDYLRGFEFALVVYPVKKEDLYSELKEGDIVWANPGFVSGVPHVGIVVRKNGKLYIANWNSSFSLTSDSYFEGAREIYILRFSVPEAQKLKPHPFTAINPPPPLVSDKTGTKFP